MAFDLVPSPAHDDLSFLSEALAELELPPLPPAAHGLTFDQFLQVSRRLADIWSPPLDYFSIDPHIREHMASIAYANPHATAGEIIELAWRDHPIFDLAAPAA